MIMTNLNLVKKKEKDNLTYIYNIYNSVPYNVNNINYFFY